MLDGKRRVRSGTFIHAFLQSYNECMEEIEYF